MYIFIAIIDTISTTHNIITLKIIQVKKNRKNIINFSIQIDFLENKVKNYFLFFTYFSSVIALFWIVTSVRRYQYIRIIRLRSFE